MQKKNDNIQELAENLKELMNLAAQDKKLSEDFKKGYLHVAQMVVNWCGRQNNNLSNNNTTIPPRILPILRKLMDTSFLERLDN